MPKQSVPKTTPSLTDEQLQALQALIPQAFTEGKIDPEKLLASFGDLAEDRPERYSFSWAGKRDAIRLLQVSSRATLIPARDDSLDFDTTQNLFIEGDNLEVLKLLYKPYFGRVKMIYIDPPYNTGNDFVYPDNFADPLNTYLQLSGQKDNAGNLLTSNPETGGRYHSTWLSMMYPRLFLARQLLTDDGLIFISIDDHEFYNLRIVMNEIYGEENYLATFVWKRRASSALAEKKVSVDHEYVVAYQKGGFKSFIGHQKDYASYKNPDNDPNGPWTLGDLTVGMTKDQRPNQFYDLINPSTGRSYSANPNRVWSFIPESMAREIVAGRIVFPEDINKRPMVKRYKKNVTAQPT
jgi:adenine-specific DNA-methyltransferase